jgi:predicted O-methyltransferase YrrM
VQASVCDERTKSDRSNGTALRVLTGVALLRRDPTGVRFLGPFLRSLRTGSSPLADARPWLTFTAIRWLTSNIDRKMRVFEYGSGGSTLFFANRVHELVSVEHDREWHARTCEALAAASIRNCTYLLRPPRPQTAVRVASSDPAYAGLDFGDYVGSIDAYPDRSFDLVSVDGRARSACVLAALRKVKPGGLVLLDNSDRPEYRKATDRLARHERLDFRGIAPYSTEVTQTTIWRIGADARDGD